MNPSSISSDAYRSLSPRHPQMPGGMHSYCLPGSSGEHLQRFYRFCCEVVGSEHFNLFRAPVLSVGTAFHPGQEVFGRSSHGSYAEYSIIQTGTLVQKPHTLSFSEAATVPVGATTAWQGLLEYGNLQPGQRVLILGGAGGVGLFAVQFACRSGARVISTTSTDLLQLPCSGYNLRS